MTRIIRSIRSWFVMRARRRAVRRLLKKLVSATPLPTESLATRPARRRHARKVAAITIKRLNALRGMATWKV